MPVFKEKPIINLYAPNFAHACRVSYDIYDWADSAHKTHKGPSEELWYKDGFFFIELENAIIRIHHKKEE